MDIRFSSHPALHTVLILFFIALINGFYTDLIYQSNIVIAWAYDISQFLLLPFSLLYILYARHNIHPASYGIHIPGRKYKRQSLIYNSVYCVIALSALYFFTYLIIDRLIPDTQPSTYISLIPAGILKLPVVLYMSITAAVVEEITYRGIPYMLFSKYKQSSHFNTLFTLTTAILFSIVHWENDTADIAATFVFGIFAAMLYLHYKNLIPLIAAHFTTDFISFW